MPEVEEKTIIKVKIPKPHSEGQDRFVRCVAKRQVNKSGRRWGKAQPLDVLVYTPNGAVKMGELKIGDEVLTPNGIANVEGIYPQGKQLVYRVLFGDGSSTECTAEHLWTIEEHRADSLWKKRSRTLTTKQISDMAFCSNGIRRPTIPITNPVYFTSQPVPIHPYLLGVLIGDGTMRHNSVYISAYDISIRENIQRYLPLGIKMKQDSSGAHDYCLSTGNCGGKPNAIIRVLKSLGLWGKYSYEKFIPDIYKYNSEQVRLDIIRGILDTDGWVNQAGQPVLEQTSECLARDVTEVIQSLGGLCKVSTKKAGYRKAGIRKETHKVCKLSVLYKEASQLFSLPNKANKTTSKKQPIKRYFKEIKLVGAKEVQCIKISDPHGLYLTDSFIVTHNTVGVAIKALCAFQGICNACLGDGCILCDNTGKVKRKRVLYAAPTAEQVGKFWFEITAALKDAIEIGDLKKDETEHFVEIPGTETRIKAKTAWNANTLRGDYSDLLILEEYQLMNEDAWQEVGQPMLLDNDGTAIFIYTPPSLKSEGVSKAKDPRHASKLFKKAEKDTSGRWQTFHFTSYDNPTLSKTALTELTQSDDMSRDSYRREILAEDDEIETSWLVYNKFNEDLCKIKRFELPETWPIRSGHDFGSANPAALFVAQVKLPLPPQAPKYLRYGDYVAFAEYAPGGGFSAEQHVEAFGKITRNRNVASSVGGNITTEKEIRDLYTKARWHISAPKITRVNAQIDRAIAVMEQNQFYVFDDLFQLLAQLANCMWILDAEQRPTNKIKDESSYHLLACLRYLATILSTRLVDVTDGEIGETRWDDDYDEERPRPHYERISAGR